MSDHSPIQTPPPDDNNWRDELLASLLDTGVQSAPRNRFKQMALPLLGMFGLTIFSAVVNELLKSAASNDTGRLLVLVFSIPWTLFTVLVLARIYNRFLRRTWQVKARSAEEELRHNSSRRPVLYLRSFNLDDAIGRPSLMERCLGTVPFSNPEQRLAYALGGLGPLIAIGRPGEKLPALGAARFYVSHDRWQEKVADVVRVAQFVVWATGTSEGLRWEISHLIKSLPPEKLILWAHPHLLRISSSQREVEWARFRSLLGSLFPHPLPEPLGKTRFIHFNAEYQPLTAPSGGLGLAQETAVRRLFRAKGLPNMDWGDFLLGFKGRINRAKYWSGSFLGVIILMIWVGIFGSLESAAGLGQTTQIYLWGVVFLIIALVPPISIGVKRLHDRAKSGWWLLPFYMLPATLAYFALVRTSVGYGLGQTIVSVVSILLCIWTLIELGGRGGTHGHNLYGPDPKSIRILDVLTWPPLAPIWGVVLLAAIAGSIALSYYGTRGAESNGTLSKIATPLGVTGFEMGSKSTANIKYTSSPVTLYEDSFSSIHNFPEGVSGPCKTRYTDYEGYVIHLIPPATQCIYSLNGAGFYTGNIRVQVHMTLLAGKLTQGPALMFGNDRNDSSHFYALFISASGEFCLSTFSDHTWVDLIPWSFSSSIRKGLGVSNGAAVEIEGYTIRVYINRKYVASVQAPSEIQGRVGIYLPWAGMDASLNFIAIEKFNFSGMQLPKLNYFTVYNKGFADPNARLQDGNCSAWYENNAYHMHNAALGGPCYQALFPSGDVNRHEHFRLEATAQFQESPEEGEYGLTFGFPMSELTNLKRSSYVFFVTKNGAASLVYDNPGGRTLILLQKTKDSLISTSNRSSNQLAVEIFGRSINCYVNGKYLGTGQAVTDISNGFGPYVGPGMTASFWDFNRGVESATESPHQSPTKSLNQQVSGSLSKNPVPKQTQGCCDCGPELTNQQCFMKCNALIPRCN